MIGYLHVSIIVTLTHRTFDDAGIDNTLLLLRLTLVAMLDLIDLLLLVDAHHCEHAKFMEVEQL